MKIKIWHILIFIAVIILVALILRPGKFRTGWMHIEGGKAGYAVTKFQELYKEDPENHRTIALLTRALEEDGQIKRAEKLYEELIVLKPRDKYYKELVRFYTWSGQPIKVKDALSRWRTFRLQNNMSFDNEEGIKLLEELYGYDLLYQDYDGGIEILKQQWDLEKDRRADIDADLITLYEITGDIDATVAHIMDVLKRDPHNEHALDKLIELAPIANKVTFAETTLIKNIENNPKNPNHWRRLINFETDIDNLESASAWHLKWLDANPGNDDLQFAYVEWLMATSQDHKAKSYILSIDRTGKYADYYDRTLNDLYEWTGDKNAMFRIYLARFHRNPRNRYNNKQLLDLVFDLKRYEVGEEVLRTLTRIYPDDPEYAILLDDLLSVQKKEQQSLVILERAAEKSPNPKILKRLGERYLWSISTAPAKREEKETGERMIPNQPSRWIERTRIRGR